MEDVKYVISCNGKILAWFKQADDRDRCLDLLKSLYNDCKWEAQDLVNSDVIIEALEGD